MHHNYSKLNFTQNNENNFLEHPITKGYKLMIIKMTIQLNLYLNTVKII